MTDIEQGGGSRDLFWRRLAAAAIDVTVLVGVASVAAVLLYAASDGRLRSSTLLKTIGCRPTFAISANVLRGVVMPPGARAVAAKLCVVSTAGQETARYLTVELQAQEGEVTRTLGFSRPVDRKGEPIAPMILDWIYPLGFLVIMSLMEWLFGTTLGKRALGLKVQAAGGGRVSLTGAALRNLVIYGGAGLVLVAPLLAAVAGIRLPQMAYYAAVGGFGLLVLAPFAMLAEGAPRALYDRWAGAQVVRS